MTITRVGFNSANTGGANLTIALPGGTAANDVALFLITQRLGGGVCGTPAGWSIIPGFPFPPALNDGVQGFYKVLVGGDANPQSLFTNISGQGVTGVLGVYRGVDIVNGPFAMNAQGTYYGTAIGPQAVGVNLNRIAYATIVELIGHLYVSGAPTINNANGFTNRQALGVGTSWPCHATMLDKDITDAYNGWTGVTATANFNAWDVQIALMDATQPNRFNMAQGSSVQPIIRTDFPKPRIGTQAFNGGVNLTLPIPTGTVVGECMIAAIVGDGFSVTPPAGWTLKRHVIEPVTSRPIDVFTRKYQAGDANPTFTLGHSSARNFGVIVSFENGDIYDHDVTRQNVGAADHAGPLLTGLDDAYNYAIQFNLRYYDGENATLTDLKAGSEFGFARLAGFTSTGAGWGIGLTIYGRQALGAGNIQGPTVTRSGGGAGAIVLVQVQAFHQPVYIDADIHQGSTASAAIHADVGYPIEVHIQQGSHASAVMKASWPKSRPPQRELVWVKNYDGDQVMVID